MMVMTHMATETSDMDTVLPRLSTRRSKRSSEKWRLPTDNLRTAQQTERMLAVKLVLEETLKPCKHFKRLWMPSGHT